MPFYQKLGQIPRKHHIWFHRNGAAPTFKNEGIAYEHVITTEGFNEAFSSCIACVAHAPQRQALEMRRASKAAEVHCVSYLKTADVLDAAISQRAYTSSIRTTAWRALRKACTGVEFIITGGR